MVSARSRDPASDGQPDGAVRVVEAPGSRHEPRGRPARATRARGHSGRQPVGAVAAALRRDLANGEFSPRERLVEADLVARYGAPRAAVREVLIQLATEGLIERAPNRGARVRGMTLQEAIEIAEVRRELETLCATLAAERASPSARAEILVLAEALRDAADADDVGTYLRLNARFHGMVHDAARHSTARAILAQFQHRPIDRFFPAPFRPVPPTASVVAHLRIASAVAACDPQAAGRAMHEHMSALIETLTRFDQRSRDRG